MIVTILLTISGISALIAAFFFGYAAGMLHVQNDAIENGLARREGQGLQERFRWNIRFGP